MRRSLSRVEASTNHAVHVGPHGREHDTSREAGRALSPCDDDAIRALIGQDAVTITESGSVRDIRIDLRDSDLVGAVDQGQGRVDRRGEELGMIDRAVQHEGSEGPCREVVHQAGSLRSGIGCLGATTVIATLPGEARASSGQVAEPPRL